MMNLMRVARLTTWLLVFILVLYAGQESVEGRRRNRMNRTREEGSKRKSPHKRRNHERRHHERRSNALQKEEVTSLQKQQQLVLQTFKIQKSKPYRPRFYIIALLPALVTIQRVKTSQANWSIYGIQTWKPIMVARMRLGINAQSLKTDPQRHLSNAENVFSLKRTAWQWFTTRVRL